MLYASLPQSAGALTPEFIDGLSQSQPQSESKSPGLFGRIRQQPGGSRALIALGASLLSNQNFFEGLGQGAMAYENTLEEERRRREPQLTRDGNFVFKLDPETGATTFERTAAGDFEEQMSRERLQALIARTNLQELGDTERLGMTLGQREREDVRRDDTQRYGIDQRDRANERNNETDLQIAEIRGQSALEAAVARQGGVMGKPPPASVSKQVNELTLTRDAQGNALANLDPVLQAINTGDLSFNIASNLRHKAAIATGIGGNEETVWFSRFQTSLESLRNALLVANKGVQTDGDAERAMAELVAGTGNTDTVRTNLEVVLASLRRRQDQAQSRIDDIATQYRVNVSNSSPDTQRPAASRGRSNGVSWRVID